jgi:N-acetylglutamate synthase-like GNAT family acetyltransferase
MLWVVTPKRASGIGAHLLQMMEDYAVIQEIFHSHLQTTESQAREFYEEHG